VTAVVEERFVVGREGGDKTVEGAFHLLQIGIGDQLDLKLQFAQGGGDQIGVVDGVAQRAVAISGIADHEGFAGPMGSTHNQQQANNQSQALLHTSSPVG